MSFSAPVKNVLILGATGPLGLAITREALLQNLHPTLFVRNLSKLPEDISGHPDVTIIKGTLPSAPETLFPTIATTNFTTIISALGPSTFYRTPNLEVSTFYTTLLTYLSLPSFPEKPYILALSTPSFPSKEDRFSLLLWFATSLLWLLIPGAYHDVRANANVFLEFAAKQDRGEEVRWTVYRVGNLSDEVKVKGEGEKKVARAGYIGDGKSGLYVHREGIARWLIRQAEAVASGTEEAQEGNLGLKWVRKVPLLSDALVGKGMGGE